jgi:hypothetical protein
MEKSFLGEKQQYRLALCGHKAVEAAAVCVVLMVQGNLAAVTLVHLVIAGKTGLLAVVPVLIVTFTRQVKHFLNRWTASAFLGCSTFLADAVVHRSHYPGEFTEAVLTGIGAFFFSLAISYTPIGRRIDRLAETFLHHDAAREARRVPRFDPSVPQ